MRIVLDVMGGDLTPQELIKGGVTAGKRHSIDLLFAGDPSIIREALSGLRVPIGGQFDLLPCSQVIQMNESPVKAIREKKDSSLVVGLTAVRDGVADGFVSPGNTGGIVAAALLTLGRCATIPRPGILAILPTLSGPDLLAIDVGANADSTAEQIEAFARMGVTYARDVLQYPDPSVGLLNIGTEETKGNRLALETYARLSESPLRFSGNVEPHGLLVDRPVDVVACDGYIGNIFLKSVEGGISAVTSLLKKSITRDVVATLGALLLRRAFSNVREVLSYERRGGASLLGVNGTVVIAHGRSDAEAIASAIDVARRGIAAGFVERISSGIEQGWSADGG
jgi:glycerol-3-phosphate acyltransferase PlsX